MADYRVNRRQFVAASMAPLVASGSSPAVGFAIGTYGMKPLDTVAALRAISDIGYDGVSLALMPGWKSDPAQLSAGALKEIGAALADLKLTLAAVNDQLP